MANEVKTLNTIAITDIKKVNGLTDDDIKEFNAQEFAGYGGVAGSWHGARFVAMGGKQYNPYTGGAFLNVIQYKAATSTGNASDFGDTQDTSGMGAGFSNGTRMVAMDGET